MKKEDSSTTPIENKSFLSIPAAIIIGALLIAISILLTGGIIRIKGVNDSQRAALGSNPLPTTVTAPTGGDEEPEIVQVSVDDDPVLGDKNAPLTMIEFSDYECPFCKRYFDQTYPQIIKEYVDAGKLKIVFRDLPLSFHDPLATKEAIAANCAKEQGGDPAYFRYHDEVFKRTTSGGNGLSVNQLYTIAQDLGFNSAQFNQCVDSDKYKEEVQKDLADASKAGATGTPSFFIGKSTNTGTIEGQKVVGAQPFSVFKEIIDSLL